jgi:RNA polymerase sigma factor (sigma-70 family)
VHGARRRRFVQAPSPAGASGVVTFEELCVLALARLPERLRGMRVPASDVDDLVHDVLLVALPKLGQFQPRRLGWEEEVDVDRSLLAWLVGIAWHLALRRRTSARSRLEQCSGNVADPGAAGDGSPTPEDLAARGQQRDLALDVLAELRPERAEVLFLHDVAELPVSEIAGRLKVNPNTAKSRLLRARRDIQEVVQRMHVSDGDVECLRPRRRGGRFRPAEEPGSRRRRRSRRCRTPT